VFFLPYLYPEWEKYVILWGYPLKNGEFWYIINIMSAALGPSEKGLNDGTRLS
jgi:hypothetical protein